jgi:hypothetical protein
MSAMSAQTCHHWTPPLLVCGKARHPCWVTKPRAFDSVRALVVFCHCNANSPIASSPLLLLPQTGARSESDRLSRSEEPVPTSGGAQAPPATE